MPFSPVLGRGTNKKRAIGWAMQVYAGRILLEDRRAEAHLPSGQRLTSLAGTLVVGTWRAGMATPDA